MSYATDKAATIALEVPADGVPSSGFRSWMRTMLDGVKALFTEAPAARRSGPRFAIYYNRLETIAGLNSVDKASRYIADNFDVMVLHYGLDDPGTAGHAEAVQVVAQVLAIRPDFEFYGYVHMGTTVAPVLSLAELEDVADRWIDMGCAGCFLDESEFAFGTTRQRLNHVLDYLHALTTASGRVAHAIVNCWDHTDLNSDAVNETNNPTGEPAAFIPGDAVHHESLAFNNEQPDYQGANNAALGSTGVIHAWFLEQHEEVTRQLRQRFGLRYYAVNTYDPASSPEVIARAFAVCQIVGKIVGADGVGLTVKDFGASGAGVYKCPAFAYDADWSQWVSMQPLIEWAADHKSVKRGNLRFFSEYGTQWWTGPKHAVKITNEERTSTTPAADLVLRVPFKKGTVPFVARLMPFGNSSPANAKVAMAAVCVDGSSVAWNDGQSSAIAFAASADSQVVTENHGWDSTLWTTGYAWSLPVYGRREIMVRGSFVATDDGVLEVRWSANAGGEDVIMTVGSTLEVQQQ